MAQPTPNILETEFPTTQIQRTPDELEDLIYLISHDLRASLRALLEVPQWIEEDIYEMGHHLGESLKDNISLMNTHTKRLDRMLCDLLVFSRIGRMQQIANLDLAHELDEVISSLPKSKDFLIERRLEWTSIRFGDRDLSTLISALISNAMKHHGQGRGHILIETVIEAGQKVLYVSDDGRGIEAKFAELIFDIMQTLRPREEVEGSGMGLATARKIASQYNGQLTLEPSRLDTGATFRFAFGRASDRSELQS